LKLLLQVAEVAAVDGKQLQVVAVEAEAEHIIAVGFQLLQALQ
jgi:hypothetical protein